MSSISPSTSPVLSGRMTADTAAGRSGMARWIVAQWTTFLGSLVLAATPAWPLGLLLFAASLVITVLALAEHRRQRTTAAI